jgi:hypothetical protein
MEVINVGIIAEQAESKCNLDYCSLYSASPINISELTMK